MIYLSVENVYLQSTSSPLTSLIFLSWNPFYHEFYIQTNGPQVFNGQLKMHQISEFCTFFAFYLLLWNSTKYPFKDVSFFSFSFSFRVWGLPSSNPILLYIVLTWIGTSLKLILFLTVFTIGFYYEKILYCVVTKLLRT